MTEDKKLVFDFNLPKIDIPEIRLPSRDNDCPAAPVCEAVGNLRGNCLSGGDGTGLKAEKCMAGIILLISRLTGMWPPQMVEKVEKQRNRMGFL